MAIPTALGAHQIRSKMAQSKAFDSNAGQWPNFSGFKPFKPKSNTMPGHKEIRVLQLESSGGATDLKFKMLHQNIDTSQFAALSYSWGAPVRSVSLKQITIEGQVVSIRPILHSFLQTLVTHDPTTRLWIDAVCINQRDTDERNQQIAMMGEIFGSAQKVYVWLGPGDDDTNYAFEHVENQQPETQFDPRQFPSCCEKIFRMSYWTRRWVIQEFALAQKLYIACGTYVVTWERLNEKINAQVLENDERALQVFDLFRQLGDLGTKKKKTLLELMVEYQGARCIDRRDRAFALRGIAKDGSLLGPDYKESVADIYFRILSQLPTIDVLPKMRGFRWPHRAGNQLQECLLVSKDDLLGSLRDKSSDRLFTTFEFVGTVSSIDDQFVSRDFSMFTKLVQLSVKQQTPVYKRHYPVPPRQDHVETLLGSENLQPGDLVYSLQTFSMSSQGLYIAFRPDNQTSTIVGILLNTSDPSLPAARGHTRLLNMIGQTCLVGITRCSRKASSRSVYNRILCHISRHMMVLLWTLNNGQEHHLIDHYEIIDNTFNQYHDEFACNCNPDPSSKPLEALPPALLKSNVNEWSTTSNPLWDPSTSPSSQLSDQYQALDTSPTSVSAPNKAPFLHNGRTHMSYAASEGLHQHMNHQHHHDPNAAQTPDLDSRNPLSHAASTGQIKSIQKLLHWAPESAQVADRNNYQPLTWAIVSNHPQAVQTFLDCEDVDPNFRHLQFEAPPLSWAAMCGHTEVVEVLLASGKIDVAAKDSDFMSPLLWAARYGHEEIVALLLRTKQVNVNVRDSSGRTPLSWAAVNGDVGIVKLLLADEAVDPGLFDNARTSPLTYAWGRKHDEIAELLIAAGKVRESRSK